MNKQDYIDGAESALLHTYNRFPLVIDHGDGVYLYDTDGKSIWILQQESPCRHLATTTKSITTH